MGTEQDSDKADSVVVRCGDCKRVIFAAVNKPRVMDTEIFRDIGRMVSQGHIVEHMTVENVRKAAFGCKCKDPHGR